MKSLLAPISLHICQLEPEFPPLWTLWWRSPLWYPTVSCSEYTKSFINTLEK
ncbi:MAG: hypothetical protein RM021_022565 [Nostoc sp. EkiNYC01]